MGDFMNKIQGIEILANTKYLSLYDLKYKNKNGKDSNWTVASRKSINDLNDIYLNNKNDKVDAVVLVPYHIKEKKLVMIKQFRVPINNYVYELPAGLIDNNEDIENAVKRELKEETGLDVLEIIKSKEKLYLSPGMSDESVSLVYCLCQGNTSKDYLEEEVDIETVLLDKEEAKKILQSNVALDIKAYIILNMFINSGENLFGKEIFK